MQMTEGQIFEGAVTALGGDGPTMQWIVVSPHHKSHAHSLGDPLELHCMPLGILQQHLVHGRLRFLKTDPQHPVIRLQREKERRGLEDVHMGLQGAQLEQMLRFLEEAAAAEADYVRHLAGEILALSRAAPHSEAALARIQRQVTDILGS
jgi:hypothetical protein